MLADPPPAQVVVWLMSLVKLPTVVLPDGRQMCGSSLSQRLRSSSFSEVNTAAVLISLDRTDPVIIFPTRKAAESKPTQRTKLATRTSIRVKPFALLLCNCDIAHRRNCDCFCRCSICNCESHRARCCLDHSAGEKLQCRCRSHRDTSRCIPQNSTPDVGKSRRRRHLARNLIARTARGECDLEVITLHDGLIARGLDRTACGRHGRTQPVGLECCLCCR